MIGKTVKVNHGLFAGTTGVVSNKFTYAGEEKYTVKIIRKENDGNMYNAFATVTLDEMTVL